jgi:hypothetical protein
MEWNRREFFAWSFLPLASRVAAWAQATLDRLDIREIIALET